MTDADKLTDLLGLLKIERKVINRVISRFQSGSEYFLEEIQGKEAHKGT